MNSFGEAAAKFRAARKITRRKIRWQTKTHPDYSEAVVRLYVEDSTDLAGELRIIVHRTREPRKFSFSLLFRRERILSLDVNPGHTHFSITDLKSIQGTHWQKWPNTDAIPDSRAMSYKKWLDEFLERANIAYSFPYKPPPFGEQLGLGL